LSEEIERLIEERARELSKKPGFPRSL